MVDWSDDRLAALSDQELKNLLVNAERKSATDLIAKCTVELEKRNALKPRKASKPRTELKEFEHEISGQLAAVGKEMAEKYDLSEETAKAKSAGHQGLSLAQAARCPGLCQARRIAARRDGGGRPLYFLSPRQ